MSDLKQTSLHAIHVELGAKMVPFAGYDMPVQYPMGVLKEHLHTREKAGLFDVSHMGQVFLVPSDKDFGTVAKALEKLVPADIQSLAPGQQRYSQFLNEDGGILDDLMISRLGMKGYEHVLYLVVNAGCKDADYAHLSKHMPKGVEVQIKDDTLALIALQGPRAKDILGCFNADVEALTFMTHTDLPLSGTLDGDPIWAHVSRSGYTGEDGYEISVKHDDVGQLVEELLKYDDVEPIGLGARDSLRMEAGLCLYGHDIDTTTSPIEAGLIWSIQKNRRDGGGYLGAARVEKEIANKPKRKLVGIKPEGRAPAREHTEIQDMDGNTIGEITSGGFGPTVEGPVAMGYVATKFAKTGTDIQLIVRGKARPATVVKMPFAPHRYYRGT
ncbi:glycine cleavage system aminomethyltransferase GcvT [Litorimonas sp. RW-G-Af-16]|uniref:glycine cleavage system aminomethyltransferase GcvT n=1 Tax=Litorimonas sp. RW-G-Af-16 TaxID=3241168 RepID=UPI00390CAD4B